MENEEVDISKLEEKIDRLFETARNLPDKEGTELFEAKILPLIKIQRSFLRKSEGGIPQAVFD